MSANEEGVIEFKGDSSLTRDENGSWSNYVAVYIKMFFEFVGCCVRIYHSLRY